MRCNLFVIETMQMKGFLAMYAIVHSPRYQTTSRSYWECSLPTFRELIGYKLKFGTFLGTSTLSHITTHIRISIKSSLWIYALFVRVLSMHIICMQCLCQFGTHEVNPFDLIFNVHAHVVSCPLFILKHDVKCIAF